MQPPAFVHAPVQTARVARHSHGRRQRGLCKRGRILPAGANPSLSPKGCSFWVRDPNKNFFMSAFADLADAATRSSVGHLFRQLLLATPKTRGLTMTLTRAGDLKFSSYPVQQPSRRAAMQQQSRSSPKGGPPQRSAPHAPPRRVADRAAVERAGQPPPYPKPSTAKEEQAPHPGVPAPAAPPPAQPAAPPPAQPALDPGARLRRSRRRRRGTRGPCLRSQRRSQRRSRRRPQPAQPIQCRRRTS